MQHIVVLSNNLAASVSSSTFTPTVSVPSDILVSVEVDNGADLAPTSAPIGNFFLMVQVGGIWYQWVDAYGTLAGVAPVGNTLLRKTARIVGVPALPMRIDYVVTSGGGAGTACTMTVSTH